jgi:hypothetical protein
MTPTSAQLLIGARQLNMLDRFFTRAALTVDTHLAFLLPALRIGGAHRR